jgi:hypothetical protein
LVALGEAVVFAVVLAGLVVVVEFDVVVLPLVEVVVVVLLVVVPFVLVVDIGVLIGVDAVVFTIIELFALLAALLAVLFAGASPQAMPRAPRPRTAESAIAFFILFRLLIFLKKIYLFIARTRLIRHSRFSPRTLSFSEQTTI